MSLLRIPQPSSGSLAKTYQLSWADFVQHVLELTIAAYQEMRQKCPVDRSWEENVFTLRLGEDYLRPLAFDSNSPIRVLVRPKTHTQQMKNGTQATIEAKEIDLQLFNIWERDYHKKHFVWEAKRVGDKRVNTSYSNLNSEYVNEAIYRFIRREYADKLSDAGVLAYVLGGNVANIVDDINESMGRIRKNPPLPKSDRLQVAPPMHNFADIYRSHHERTDASHIRLHHLFLEFA